MIGTGYVGLVSGACFANFGHHVVCGDKNVGKIAALSRGELPIEPGLPALVQSNLREGRLKFATDVAERLHRRGHEIHGAGRHRR
jgi:UDPglucose 6-dehydrogenase